MAAAQAAVRLDEPTEQQLREAWSRMRKPSWPATFEEAMSDAMYGGLVRMGARHPEAAQPPQRHRWPFMASARHRYAATSAPAAQPAHAPVIDRKRAAAGDRDD